MTQRMKQGVPHPTGAVMVAHHGGGQRGARGRLHVGRAVAYMATPPFDLPLFPV